MIRHWAVINSTLLDRATWFLLRVFGNFEHSYPTGEHGLFPTSADWYDLKLRRLIDKPPVIYEGQDGHSVFWAIRTRLATLKPRESQILLLRSGLGNLGPLTFEGIAPRYHVTSARIEHIEGKALRKLRYPSRANLLREFLYTYTRRDGAAFLARKELFDALTQHIPAGVALDIAARVQREYLAESLRVAKTADLTTVGRLAAASCRVLKPGECCLCGEPSLPGIQWCLRHMLPARNSIVLVCDGCGMKFLRNACAMVRFSRWHGRTQHAVFHDNQCFYKNARRVGIYSHRQARQQDNDNV